MSSADFLLVKPLKLDGAVSFSRASDATYFDAAGVLQTAPPNTLRVTYDPADLSKAPYALVEKEPAINRLIWSEQFDNAASWIPTNVTPTAAMDINSPRGTNTAFKITGSAGMPNFRKMRTGDSGLRVMERRTFSVFAKAAELSQVQLQVNGYGGNFFNAAFDLIAGVRLWQSSQGSASEVTSGMLYVGNGWWRIWVTGIPWTGDTRYGTDHDIFLVKNRSNYFDDNGTSGLYIFGANVSPGEISSYIHSAGSTITRAADVVGPGAGLVYSNVPITEPLRVAGTYALGAKVRDAANFVFESLVAGNTAVLTDKTKWLPLGITNRLKMFDKAVNSQTTAPDSLTVVVKAGQLANTLTLLNVGGSEVTVTQSDSGYSRRVSLVSHNVLSWYDFWYQEPQWVGDITIGDIPPYINSLLTIHVKSPTNLAALGGFFLGRAKFIGKTQWGLKAALLSYSGEEEDDFGNVTLLPRPGAKKMNFEVAIPRGYEDEVYRFLTAADNVEMVAIASTNWSMTQSYGYLGQWEVPLGIEGEKMPVEWRGLI